MPQEPQDIFGDLQGTQQPPDAAQGQNPNQGTAPQASAQPGAPTGPGNQKDAQKPDFFAELQGKPPEGAAAPEPPKEESIMDRAMGSVTALFAGAKRQMDSNAEGLVQAAYKGGSYLGIDTSRQQESLRQLREQRQAEFAPIQEANPIAAGVGQVAGDVVTMGATAGPIGAAAKAAGLGAAATATGGLARAAGGSAAYTGATQYGTGAERAQAAGTSAALTGVLGGLAMAPEKIGKGVFKGSEKKAGELYDQAEKLGVRNVSLGQASGREGLQSLEVATSKIPLVGPRQKFQNQAADVTNAGEDILGKISSSIPKAKNPDAYFGKTTREQIFESVKQKAEGASKVVNGAYDRFSAIASKLPDDMPLTNARDVAQDLLKPSSGLGTAYSSSLNAAIKDVIARPSRRPESLREIMPAINKIMESADNAGDTVTRSAAKKLKDALIKDASVLPEEAKNAFTRANQMHVKYNVPLRQDKLTSKILDGSINSDDILKYAMKPDAPETMTSLMKNLTPHGRGELRAAVFRKAINQSKGNLEKFGQKIDNLGESLGKVFTPSQKAEITGLRKFMEATKRGTKAGQSESVWGESILAYMAVGTAYAVDKLGTAGLAAGAFKGLTTAMTSPKVGKLLLKMAKTPDGSRASSKVAAAIAAHLTKDNGNTDKEED